MLHVLHLKVVHACLSNLDGTRPSAAAKERLTGRVGSRHAVNNQRVVMESRHLRLGGHRPCAAFLLLHVVFLAAQVNLHQLCLRGIHAKHHAVVLQHPRIAIVVDVRHWRVGVFGHALPTETLR